MRCLFCKKEIGNATSFCPECGQKLEQYIQSPEIENYWSEVNKADSQRNEQYKSRLEETTKARCRKINKSIAIFVFIVVIIMTVVFGIIKYNDYLKKMDAEVQPNNFTYTQNKEVTDSSKQNDLTEYILPNSNSEYISYSDLEGLSQTEVSLARNEIYARHGRKFETDSIREYFEMKTWYEPSIDSDNFSESVFNNYEKDNIKTIINYEEEKGWR